MEDSPRPHRLRLFWPLVFITGGVLLLLDNFGMLPPGMWNALGQLWPVVLILLGLEMLVGRRSFLGSLLILIVGIVVVAGSLTWAALQATALPPGETKAIVQTFKEAKTAEVSVAFQSGNLQITTLGPSDHLMEGTLALTAGETMRQNYTVANGVGQLQLEQKLAALFAPFLGRQENVSRWAVQLNRNTPLALTVNTGAGETTLDLTDLHVTRLSLSSGVGKTTITFPANGPMAGEINAGVGELIINVPLELPARISVAAGVTGLTVDARFSSQNGDYTTPNFDPSGQYLDLKINTGVGKITIQ
jgi:hypothetical protein